MTNIHRRREMEKIQKRRVAASRNIRPWNYCGISRSPVYLTIA